MSPRILVVKREAVEPYIRTRDCVSLVESAFAALAQERAELPGKYHHRGTFGFWFFMGGEIEPSGAMGVKLGCSHAGRLTCQVICYDPETMQPLALMEGLWVTSLRTGAAAAIGARHLARPESKVAGIVGAGSIGRASLAALSSVFALEKVCVADASDAARQAFVEFAQQRYPLAVVETSIEEAARAADILVTATPARQAIVQAEWLRPGTHISAMGADGAGKQELASAVHQKARIVCDSVVQCVQWGDINNSVRAGLLTQDQIIGEIGEVILGRKPGRTSPDDITLFDSTGLGIQDAAIARLIYETAERNGLGTWAEL